MISIALFFTSKFESLKIQDFQGLEKAFFANFVNVLTCQMPENGQKIGASKFGKILKSGFELMDDRE